MREMKDSGIEWIGEIPISWRLEKLQWCMDEINIKNDPVQTENVLSLTNKLGVVPYKEKGNQGNKSKEDYSEYKVAFENTLIVNSMNVIIGSVGISKYYGCISPVYYVFRENEFADLRFINYIFSIPGFQKELRKYAKGILEIRLRISSADLFKRPIPLPSITEQHNISNFLDSKCAEIDSVLERTRISIEEYKKLKQAVITQAVTKGVRGKRPMKDSGVEWIGSIPEDWQIFRVANLYREASDKGNDELPILTVSINSGVSDRELSDEESERVFVRSEDRSKYKRVQPGDLVYNMMRAWQGAFGAVRVDGMVSPAYVVARPIQQLDSRYVEYLFRTPEAIEEMHRYSYGVADFRLRLYWPQFRNIRMCVPPYEEQVEIADYIDEKVQKILALIKKKEQYLVELENYKKSLIYEYVTGKKEVPYNER